MPKHRKRQWAARHTAPAQRPKLVMVATVSSGMQRPTVRKINMRALEPTCCTYTPSYKRQLWCPVFHILLSGMGSSGSGAAQYERLRPRSLPRGMGGTTPFRVFSSGLLRHRSDRSLVFGCLASRGGLSVNTTPLFAGAGPEHALAWQSTQWFRRPVALRSRPPVMPETPPLQSRVA